MKYIKAALDLKNAGFHLNVDITISSDEITGLYGPSGSGKSTILRLIAGLESNLTRNNSTSDHQAMIEVSTDQEIWSNENQFKPAHLRKIGYVFQHPQLFPHLSVLGNLQYAIQRKKNSTDIELEQVTQWLGIQSLLLKSPTDLSGGEKQRVSIARVLLSGAEALLMDEPLAALDHQAKHRILPYIDRLHNRLHFPFLYVSHAMDEISYLTDYMHILEKGSLTQSGSTLELSPSLTVNENDSCAIVKCSVESFDENYKLTKLDFENQTIYVAGKRTDKSNIKLNVPARDVSITLERQTASSILNILQGSITNMHSSEDGSSILVQIQVGNQYLLSRITRRSMEYLAIKIGQSIYAQIKSVSLVSEYAD